MPTCIGCGTIYSNKFICSFKRVFPEPWRIINLDGSLTASLRLMILACPGCLGQEVRPTVLTCKCGAKYPKEQVHNIANSMLNHNICFGWDWKITLPDLSITDCPVCNTYGWKNSSDRIWQKISEDNIKSTIFKTHRGTFVCKVFTSEFPISFGLNKEFSMLKDAEVECNRLESQLRLYRKDSIKNVSVPK